MGRNKKDYSKCEFKTVVYLHVTGEKKNGQDVWRVRCKQCSHEWDVRGGWLAHYAKQGKSRCPKCGRKSMGSKITQQAAERRAEIVARWGRGETLQEIGDAYSISRERVRQLLAYSLGSDLRAALAKVPPDALLRAVQKIASDALVSKLFLAAMAEGAGDDTQADS